jgi:hypothetical protein
MGKKEKKVEVVESQTAVTIKPVPVEMKQELPEGFEMMTHTELPIQMEPEPVIPEEPPAEQTIVQDAPASENQIIVSHLKRLVEDFESQHPADSDGSSEDMSGKRYNDKTAQIGGVLLAAAVSIKEIMGLKGLR